MNDNKTEPNPAADAEALNGLPDKERKETEEILGEIRGEDARKAGDAPETPAKPEDKKPEEVKPPVSDRKPDGSKDDGDKEGQKRREGQSVLPAWLHERAKADWTKKETALLAEIENLKSSKPPTNASEQPKPTEDDKELVAIAEKHGVSPDLLKDLMAVSNKKMTLPAEISQKLEVIEQERQKAVVASELASFNADFDKFILPAIQAEYGSDVPQSVIDTIREEVKVKAYTPEFAKVPYSMIYKGDDQFRGRVAPIKKGAEKSRGGSMSAALDNAASDTQVDLTKELSAEELAKLTDAQFDQYSDNMAKRSK